MNKKYTLIVRSYADKSHVLYFNVFTKSDLIPHIYTIQNLRCLSSFLKHNFPFDRKIEVLVVDEELTVIPSHINPVFTRVLDSPSIVKRDSFIVTITNDPPELSIFQNDSDQNRSDLPFDDSNTQVYIFSFWDQLYDFSRSYDGPFKKDISNFICN